MAEGTDPKMTRLLLLRHARAAWAEPGMRDFDRPLDSNGLVDADAMGASLFAGGLLPQRIICSSARRARETWEKVGHHLEDAEVSFTDLLYSSDATGYVNFIREHGSVDSLMIVGHNPMIEDTCFALAPDGAPAALQARANGFPACGLAVIRFPGSLAEAGPGRGHLDAFLTPADR